MTEGDLDEFRLVRPLGSGGMGVVFLGHDTVLDRSVAIKLIRGSTDSGSRERFLTEARAIARLSHPNVVTIFRVGTTAGGQPFLVQELIRGKSLDLVPRPLPWREVCELAIGIARGLAAAHRRGILHRDIKPANVMIDEHGTARLLDFGLAKLSIVEPPSLAPLVPRFASGSAPGAVAERGAPVTVEVTPVMPVVRDVAETRDATPSNPVHAPTEIVPSFDPISRTMAEVVIGTPRYTAPENWMNGPSTAQSDLYSLGVMIYELLTGTPPFAQTDLEDLRRAVLAGDPRPVEELAPDTPATLARNTMRCLALDPAARPDSASELAHELEAMLAGTPGVPEGNPYRGLRSFDAAHRGLFFGRGVDVGVLVDRLRSEPLLVVVGDSGIGKSSVCHAGVAPVVLAGGLGDRRRWRVVTLVPGRAPWKALCDACGMVAETADQLIAALRPPADGGILLVIDQLEELVTLAEPDEATRTAAVLATVADGIPGLKAMLAVRGDFLTRVAVLPDLGPPMSRGLHLLRPLSAADLREAVIGPARAKGVHFETEAMVTSLVEAVADNVGALPLLQFTLAELWQARDHERGVIPARALDALGGVEGGLAGHADAVLFALPAKQRTAARGILLRLVSDARTRAVRDRDELVGDDAVAAAALEVLVRGRLVVARDAIAGTPTYELAHEALIRSWGTLRDLLDAAAGDHAARNRLVASATEWERLGKRDDLLWTRRQLDEIYEVEGLSAKEHAFVAASRRRLRKRWLARAAAIAAVPLIALAIFVGVRFDGARTRDREVAQRIAVATTHRVEADRLAADATIARAEAFARFDSRREAEPQWAAARSLGARAAEHYRDAAAELEAGFSIDAGSVRTEMANVLVAHAQLAAAEHDEPRVTELLRRLETYAPDHAAQWRRPGHLVVELDRTARISVHAFEPEAGSVMAGGFATVPITSVRAARLEHELTPGSFVVVITMPDGQVVRDPVLLQPGEQLVRRIDIPSPRPGLVFVPAGRFSYGTSNEALRRPFLTAEPLRELELSAFWIGRTEVTYQDWIEFLRALPTSERALHRPTFETTQNTVDLAEHDGAYTLSLRPTTETFRAATDRPLVYPSRRVRAQVRWERLPVSGVSYQDGLAYAAWLDRTRRVPGARLCTVREWERAARGADGRTYPHGERLRPTDANFDETYGRTTLAFGPDEVGSFPASDSPFGIADLAGNVWELTTGPDGKPWSKGGSFYQNQLTAAATNNSPSEPGQRGIRYGLRICADSARPR
ncbi:MAG: bifunctional serine/threonine-protein kinase/formylglycine-generating enzyme family protein [Kofleriaceae bacterium]